MNALLTTASYFYKIIGARFFFLFVLVLFSSLAECFGISLLMPILQGENSSSEITIVVKKLAEITGYEYGIKNIFILLLLLITIKCFFMIYRDYYIATLAKIIRIKSKEELYSRLFRLNFEKYISYSTGYVNNTLTRELDAVIGTFFSICRLFSQLILSVLYICIPIWLEPRFVLLLIAVLLPIILICRKLIGYAKRYSVDLTGYHSNFQNDSLNCLNFYKYLRATGTHPPLLTRLFTWNSNIADKTVKQKLVTSVINYGFEPFIACCVLGIAYYSVTYDGQSLVEIGVVLLLLLKAFNGISAINKNLTAFMKSWGSINVIKKFDQDLKHHEETRESNNRPPETANISIENLTFKYAACEKALFEDLNCTIPANTTVAFVGESGSGKSTLVNLVIGLLTPTAGAIKIGGKDFQSLDKFKLRQKIGYITQESVIFNDSIEENITLWDKNASDDDVKRVACKAHILDFIEAQDRGFETQLGDNGVNISGGQRQRICIARELYKKSSILVFDEATSALDAETEKEIQRNIDELKGEKTIILIAHRLSTIKSADLIYVLDKGKIISSGTYESLQLECEYFQKLISLQA